MPPGAFPTLERVAANDAQPAATALFRGDAGGWAGNPLFLALGYSDAFEDNILEDAGNAYDAWAMIHTATVVADWNEPFAFLEQIIGYPAGGATLYNSAQALRGFMSNTYGDFSDVIGLISWNALGAELDGKVLLGQVEGNDTFTEDETTPGFPADAYTIIHAGGGDDTFQGSLGRVLMDEAAPHGSAKPDERPLRRGSPHQPCSGLPGGEPRRATRLARTGGDQRWHQNPHGVDRHPSRVGRTAWKQGDVDQA